MSICALKYFDKKIYDNNNNNNNNNNISKKYHNYKESDFNDYRRLLN